jgi:hypothetical protein
MLHRPLLTMIPSHHHRSQLLVEDYASDEARAGEEGGADAWLQSMTASVRRLRKRLGDVKVNAIVDHLSAGDYSSVARMLLGYYDALYDTHISTGGGTGVGSGARVGCVVDAVQPDDAAEIDAPGLAREVLARVVGFEQAEQQAAARAAAAAAPTES